MNSKIKVYCVMSSDILKSSDKEVKFLTEKN